jgi:hypothetical protein
MRRSSSRERAAHLLVHRCAGDRAAAVVDEHPDRLPVAVVLEAVVTDWAK